MKKGFGRLSRREIELGLGLFAAFLLLGSGCRAGRPIKGVDLPPMSFSSPLQPIDGSVEVCLTPELRRRTWNVADHPFQVRLGDRAALNFELMMKAAFREVTTNHEANCGSTHALPWMVAQVDSANRERDSDVRDEQITVVTMSFELFDADGESLWRETTVGETVAEPASIFGRHSAAARDLGHSIRNAINLAYSALLESKDVRRTFEAR